MGAMTDLRQIEFHADRKHENADADLTKKPERIERRWSEDKNESLVSYQTKERGTQKNTSGHFPQDRWLSETHKNPAYEGGDTKDDRKLENQSTELGTGVVRQARKNCRRRRTNRIGAMDTFLHDDVA